MFNALYKYISPIFGYIMLFFYGIVDGFNGSYGFGGVWADAFWWCVRPRREYFGGEESRFRRPGE